MSRTSRFKRISFSIAASAALVAAAAAPANAQSPTSFPSTNAYSRASASASTSTSTSTSASASASATMPAAASAGTHGLTSSSIYPIMDRLARQVAWSLADSKVRHNVMGTMATGSTTTSSATADLDAIATPGPLRQAISSANAAVLAAKGLPADAGSMLRIRLAQPELRGALARGSDPLVTAAPTDDSVTSFAAYDSRGGTTTLSNSVAPQRPVLVVEVDVAKALPIGLQVTRDVLAAHQITGATASTAATSGYCATKVNAVRLNNDQEPWIKGGAEIFNVVGGFGLDGVAKVDVVQMPYLDHDKTTYYPNQLLVHFSAYKYNLADVVMMEDDGDTNYQQLAIAIATALLTIVDGGVYIPLVNAILNAIPTSWWTDDPDYVDSWYTLATSSSGRLYGAAANGWMDVTPYWVAPL